MHNNPAEILKHLHAISQETIAKDLRAAEENLEGVVAEVRRMNALKGSERTASLEARIAHFMMVQAHELSRLPHVLPEFKVFCAQFGAGDIVNLAEESALDRGRLAEITQQMREIRKREGLHPDEDFHDRQGPSDHLALEDEAKHLGESIADTLMVWLLNRYHLPEEAKLYEQDRRRWEFLREAGGRAISGMGEYGEKMLDRHLAEKFGPEFVAELHARVDVLRASLKKKNGAAD